MISIASFISARRILYVHSTNLVEAITPSMRFVIFSISPTSVGLLDVVECGDLEVMSTACESKMVAMGCKPAARMVSPDSLVSMPMAVSSTSWTSE